MHGRIKQLTDWRCKCSTSKKTVCCFLFLTINVPFLMFCTQTVVFVKGVDKEIMWHIIGITAKSWSNWPEEKMRRCFYLGRTAQVAHHLTNVLDNGHVVFPAIIPKLRGGKLSFQENGWAWKLTNQKEKKWVTSEYWVWEIRSIYYLNCQLGSFFFYL